MDCCKEDATVKKAIIAVIGATGKQGGGLVQAILDDPKGGFSARALTRDPNKPAAVALKKQGADVVKFDMDDPSTHVPALTGAYGVFIVTNYWEHFSVEKEKEQAKAIAKAAEIAGIKHIIWSTLEGTNDFFDSLPEDERPTKLGDYYVPHFDGKHEGDRSFPPNKTTNLFTSFYLENFAGFGMVKDGVLCINMEDHPLPVIAAADIGGCAYEIFEAGDKYKGYNVWIAGDVLTCSQLMDIASQVTQQEFEYRAVDRDTYAGFDFPGADDLANMFYFKVKNDDFTKKRDPKKTKALYPKLQSAREWMEENVDVLSQLAKPGLERALPQEDEPTPKASPNKRNLTPAFDENISKSYTGEEVWC